MNDISSSDHIVLERPRQSPCYSCGSGCGNRGCGVQRTFIEAPYDQVPCNVVYTLPECNGAGALINDGTGRLRWQHADEDAVESDSLRCNGVYVGRLSRPLTVSSGREIRLLPWRSNASRHDHHSEQMDESNGAYVCGFPGLYRAEVSVKWSANGPHNGTRSLRLQAVDAHTNQVTTLLEDELQPPPDNTQPTCHNISRTVMYRQGDRIICSVEQDSGSSATVESAYLTVYPSKLLY